MGVFARIAFATAVMMASAPVRADVIEITPVAENGLRTPFGETVPALAIGFFSIVESHFVLEFALEVIPAGATINSASLGLRVDRLDPDAGIEVRGYSGDGVADFADLYAGTDLFSFVPPDTSLNFYDVTEFIRAQAAIGASFAGLFFDHFGPCTLNALGLNDCVRTFDNSSQTAYPRLVIDFDPRGVTPTSAPAAAALFGIGLAALAGIRRRR